MNNMQDDDSNSSATAVLSEVQVLSTIGADLIAKGELGEAAQVYTESISMLSWCMLAPTPLMDPSGDSSQQQEDPGMQVYTTFDSLKDPSACQGDFFFHPKMFEFNKPPEQDETCLTNEQYCFSVITCLYNLALCYHLEWSKTKSNSHLLCKAKHFYEEAFSMTSNCQICPTDDILDVILAICHNASHCYTELADLLQVDLWNRRLCQTLEFSKKTTLQRTASTSSPTHYQQQATSRVFFLFNAFFNSFAKVTAAAA